MMWFFSVRRCAHLSETQESSWHNFPLLALVYYDFFRGVSAASARPSTFIHHDVWRCTRLFSHVHVVRLLCFDFKNIQLTANVQCALHHLFFTIFVHPLPHIYIFHKVKVDHVGRWNIMENWNSPRSGEMSSLTSSHRDLAESAQIKLKKRLNSSAHKRFINKHKKKSAHRRTHDEEIFSMKIFIFARISLIFSLSTTSFTHSKLPIGLCAFSQYFLFWIFLSLLLISIPSHLALGGASFSSQLSFIKLKTLSREFLRKFYFSHPKTLGRDWSENSILSLTRIVQKFHLNLHSIRGWHFFGLLCGEIKPQIAVANCIRRPVWKVQFILICSVREKTR